MKLRYLSVSILAAASAAAGAAYAVDPTLPGRLAGAAAADWRNLSDAWKIAVLTIVIPVAVTIVLFLLQRRASRPVEVVAAPEFPFEVYTARELEKLGYRLLAHHYAIPYVPRLPADRQPRLEAFFDSPYLLVTGRSGLGKTRECIEAIARLARRKGEDFTILYALDHIDVPDARAIPPDLSKNVILFVNDVHQKYVVGKNARERDDQRSYHERLFDTIHWFAERFRGGDFRVIITARDEPDLRKRLKLESGVWAPFRHYVLPGLHRAASGAFVQAVGAFFKLTLTDEAIAHVSHKCDGTTASIVTVLARESARYGGAPATVELAHVQPYQFVYPQDWDDQVYREFITPHRYREAVFWALSLHYQMRVPSYEPLVVDLASQRWPAPLRLFARRGLRRTIRKDLASWMFVHAGQVICPAAYLDGKAELEPALPAAEGVLRRGLRGAETRKGLLGALTPLRYTVGEALGGWELVVRLLSEAARWGDDVASVWAGLAVAYDRLGRSAQALHAAGRAKALAPESAKSHILLAYAYTRAGEHGLALETLREATRVSPDDFYGWLSLGVVLSKGRRTAEAIAALQTACDLNPQSAKAHYSLGIAYEGVDVVRAIAECRRAAELDPYDPVVWRSLGISLGKSGEQEAAVRCLESARDLEPESASTLISLARAYDATGRTEEALAILRRVADQPNRRPIALNVLSVVLSNQGRLEEAEKAAAEAVRVAPAHVDAWKSLAIIRGRRGDLQGAARAQRRLVELRGTPGDWYALAGTLYRANRVADAARAARDGLKRYPTHFELKHSLTRSLARMGDHAGAIRLQREVAEERGAPVDWYRLGVAFGRAGRHAEAVAAGARAVGIDPDSAEVWQRLSDDAVIESPPAPPSAPAAGGADPSALADWWNSVARNLALLGRQRESAAALRQVVTLRRDANDWLRLSIALTRSGQKPQAFLAARTATGIDPASSEAWVSFAICASNVGRTAELIHAKETLTQLRGEAGDWYNLSVVYSHAKRNADAAEAARRAVEVDPEHVEAWNSLALNSGILGRVEDDLRAQARLLELRGSPQDWYHLSVALGRAKRAPEAARAAATALNMDLGSVDVLRSLAINLGQMGHSPETVSAVQAVAAHARHPLDWIALAEALGAADGDEARLAAIEEALGQDGVNAALVRLRAECLERLGREAEARDARARAAELGYVHAAAMRREVMAHPENRVRWRQFARTEHRQGQAQRAVEFGLEQLALHPTLHDEVMEIARELLDEAPEQMVPLVEAILAVAADHAEYWQILGVCRRKAGDVEAAVAAIREAIDRDAGVAGFWYALGRAYEDKPDAESAWKAYREAVELQPGYRKARERLTALTPAVAPPEE